MIRTMNPYSPFVASFARLVREGRALPLGGIAPRANPVAPAGAPVALVFSPHPDDECIVGGLALRLLRESGMRVINVAVTLGSNMERRQPRLRELRNACDWIGFGLEEVVPGGLERVTPKAREQEPAHWASMARSVSAVIARHSPRVVFVPHAGDWNGTHIGTHHLVMDALGAMPPDFGCHLVETEFWAAMAAPNLMVELGAEELADLLAALSFHAGEVSRNPYHLLLPPWMQDNVRRGAELVGGQGGTAPDYDFATLYRVRRWRNGRVEEAAPARRHLGRRDLPGALFD